MIYSSRIYRFEHAPGSVGPSSTQIWLNPYLPFIGLQVFKHKINYSIVCILKNRGSISFNYKYLPEFLTIPEYHRWSHFISLGPVQ